MPTYSRLAVRAVEETMDAASATARALDMFRQVLADGRVSPAEAQAVLDQLTRAHAEAQEAVIAAERAEFSERAVVAGLTGEVPAYLMRQARELGLRMVVVHPGGAPDGGAEEAA